MMLMKNFSPNGGSVNTGGSTVSGNLPFINEFEMGSEVNNNSSNNNNSNSTTPASSLRNGNASGTGSNDQSLANSTMMEISTVPLEELEYVKLARDQFGCRFLQKKLENPAESDAVRDLMYEQIKPYFLDLILDSFGNYLVQKLCEFLTPDQKTSLIQSIYPSVFQISINQYGTRSLQKIIDTVDNENQIDLIIKGFSQEHTLIQQVVTLINDLNGNHVIQKCIFKFPPSKFDFIIDAIVEQNNIITISTHKHGCCVLQKLLSVCTLQQIFKISVKIVQFLPGLINDQFGNYIIQFLLDIKELDFYLLAEIFNRLSNELCQLSCLKFSSNVVEKFIKKLFNIVNDAVPKYLNGNPAIDSMDDVATAAMRILLTIIDIFTVNLNVLIRDNFGNYALQTLLDAKNYSTVLEYHSGSNIVRSAQLTAFSHEFTTKIGNLVVLTKELLPSIKTTSYAKKIKLKVKSYAELTGVAFADSSPKKVNNKNNSNVNNSNPKNNGAHNNNLNHYNNKNHNNNHRNNNKTGPGVYQRQHTRHFSLPANAYHRRSSSSVSIPYAAVQQPNSQQMQPNLMNPVNYPTDSNSPLNYQPQYVGAAQRNDSVAQNLAQPMLPFVGSNMHKPNSNPSLQTMSGLQNSRVALNFMQDGASNNKSNSSSTNDFFQTATADSFMMNNFAFSNASQSQSAFRESSFAESNFTQQRIASNPFPVQQHPSPNQQQNFQTFIPTQAGDGYMYMDSNHHDFMNSSNGLKFGFN